MAWKNKFPLKRHAIYIMVVVTLLASMLLGPEVVSAFGLWNQQTKLTAFDAEPEDGFGVGIAISQNTLIVGAHGDSDYGRATGSAYVYTRKGPNWELESKLTAADAHSWDTFGYSVAIDGNTAIVGAIREGGHGAAYIFVRNKGVWVQQAKLIGGKTDKFFGISVAISGKTVLVGSNYEHRSETGAVYIFNRKGDKWQQQTKIVGNDAAIGDSFGYSISLFNNTAVIGAPSVRVDGNSGAGAAYIFVKKGEVWKQQAKLTALDPSKYSGFGHSVSLFGGTALIGAPNHLGDGAVYVFSRVDGSWEFQTKLKPSDMYNGYGYSVALFGDRALIGAWFDSDLSRYSGSAYLFQRIDNEWEEITQFYASDPNPNNFFGNSVAFQGDTVVVGSYGEPKRTFTGAVYIFKP